MSKKYIAILLMAFAVLLFAESAAAQKDSVHNSAQEIIPASPANYADAPARSIFALVAPFTTITDSVSFDAVSDFWQSGIDPSNEISANHILIPRGMDVESESIFGIPPNNTVEAVSEAEILSRIYQENAWAIIPFELLEPRLKVIQLDGKSPLSNTFDPNSWPLTARTGGSDSSDFIDWQNVPVTNRDPNKLTTLILTGVTALVRGTANYMDVWGPEYPASNIYETLRAADLLHVNNEVPFKTVCQQTQAELSQLRFCSKIAYFDLLTFIGTDVIELSGDHFQDFGDEAMYTTLELYQKNNMPYYGGGYDLTEAKKPLIMEHNQNRFAFIGCNAKEPGYSSASDIRPGAGRCDFPSLIEQVKELRSEGFLPIVTFQHIEYYNIRPNEEMENDFNAVAKAGAVIVSGSQSHIPMAMEITADSFIHYGLGNLFFDQAFFLPETSEATLDRHVFYDGRHIGTELLTIKFTNLALNRFMTEEERANVLKRIFEGSIVSVE